MQLWLWNVQVSKNQTMLNRLRHTVAFNQYKRDIFVREFVQRLKPRALVLDVGAGPGRYREIISSKCSYRAHDFGVEPSTIGKYTPLDYESDVCMIPVDDGSFDALICTEVLEHVPEPICAVKELGRILKDGGLLLLTAPLGSFLHQQPYHFYGGFTPHWYAKFLPEAGLELISIERNGGFFSFFGQEARRFCDLSTPSRLPFCWYKPIWAVSWSALVPAFLLALPMIAPLLDRIFPDDIATVGYHVIARKIPEG